VEIDALAVAKEATLAARGFGTVNAPDEDASANEDALTTI